jgi:hypothetical protein
MYLDIIARNRYDRKGRAEGETEAQNPVLKRKNDVIQEGEKEREFLTLYGNGDKLFTRAGMAELADARDLKSLGDNTPCRFDPGYRHQQKTRSYPSRYLRVFIGLLDGLFSHWKLSRGSLHRRGTEQADREKAAQAACLLPKVSVSGQCIRKRTGRRRIHRETDTRGPFGTSLCASVCTNPLRIVMPRTICTDVC